MRALTQVAEFNVTEVDRKSIMHYSLPPEIFKLGKNSRCWVPDNDELSVQDRNFIAAIYPKAGAPVQTSGAPVVGPPGAHAGCQAAQWHSTTRKRSSGNMRTSSGKPVSTAERMAQLIRIFARLSLGSDVIAARYVNSCGAPWCQARADVTAGSRALMELGRSGVPPQ